MVKVEKQLKAGDYIVLLFDSPIPHKKFSKLRIDGEEYKHDIVYDMRDALGIRATGNFEGQEVEFIT